MPDMTTPHSPARRERGGAAVRTRSPLARARSLLRRLACSALLGAAACAMPSAFAEPALASDTPAMPERGVRIGELPALLGIPEALSLPDRSGGQRLSLQQAIERGIEHSLDVQAAGARRDSFDETARAAAGALLPHLDGRAAVGNGRLESVQPTAELHRAEVNLPPHQTLFDLPSWREYNRQSVLAESSDVQLQGSISSASLDVASAYLQTTQASLNIELSRSYEALLTELLEYINNRAQAGGASNAERDRVRARVANARASIADSKATLRTLLRNLESLIGEVPGELAIDTPASLRIPLHVAEARSEAQIANHDLRTARAEIEAARLESSGYRARILPRVDVELSHYRNLNGAGTASYLRDTKLMLVVNWSLLNGGADLAQQRAASARMLEKKLRSDDTLRKLDQELEGAYSALDAVGERYDALREELSANLAVVEAFRAQLVGGNRSLLDVLDAIQRLHQSRLDMVQLAIGEVQNHVKVAHLTGRLAPAGSPR